MRKAINRHIEDFRCGFTLEFDVKNPPLNPDIQISEDNANFENEMYTFHNIHAQACFDEIMNLPDVELQITGWNFAGRSGGWFVLECDGDDDIDLGSKDIAAIEEVVEKYHKSFFQEMANFYNPCETRNFYGVSIVPVEGKSDECRLDVQKVTLSERDDDAGEYDSFEAYCEAASDEMLENIDGQGSDGILMNEQEFQEFKDKINRL